MGNNSRKFYYGDKVRFASSYAKYNKHAGHEGFIMGTVIHVTNNRNSRHTTYQVECFCGQPLEPKSTELILIQSRGLEEDPESIADKRRQYFLGQLAVEPGSTTTPLVMQVNQALSVLPNKHRCVVMDRFGLNPDYEFRRTYEEIGRDLTPPVTKQRAQQIERRAFEIMRDRI